MNLFGLDIGLDQPVLNLLPEFVREDCCIVFNAVLSMINNKFLDHHDNRKLTLGTQVCKK